MVIFYIPLGLILIFILCGIGLATEAIKSFMDALPIILIAILITIILFAIHRMIRAFQAKRYNVLYLIGEVILILSTTLGLFIYAGPTYIDHCKRWFTWFGDGLGVQILTYMGVVIIFSMVIMVIAFLIPSRVISSILLLLPIVLPFCYLF